MSARSLHESDLGSSSDAGSHSPVSDSILDDDVLLSRVVQESQRLEKEAVRRTSSSTPSVTEGPGATASSSDNPEVVAIFRVESMEVDRSNSDVPMPTVGNSPVGTGLDSVPNMAPQGDSIIDLKNFGPRYKEALKRLVKLHEEFANKPHSGKRASWSNFTRDKKLDEVRTTCEGAYLKVLEAIYWDKNVRFKPSEVSATPKLIPEESEQSTTSSPEAFDCPCEVIHAAVVGCKAGKGHRALCEIRVNRPFVAPKKLTYVQSSRSTNSPKPSTSAQARNPPPSQERRGRYEQRGRGERGHKRKDRSASSRGGQHPQNPPNKMTYRDHRMQRDRSASHTPAQERLNRPPPISSSSSGSTRPGPPSGSRSEDPIPSSEQMKRLLSKARLNPPSGLSSNEDIRLKQPGHDVEVRHYTHDYSQGATPTSNPAPGPSSKVVPAKAGESIYGPDGEVQWERIPIRPPKLPLSVHFRSWAEDGVWKVEMTQ